MTLKNSKTEISIVDIAKELGISAATVSRALNNNTRISEATRKRVKEMAKTMGYRHNSMASSLRNRRSHIIGLIVPRISMYFHSVFITSLQQQLQSAGYNLMICQSNDSVEMETELAHSLYSARVDAIVVSLTLYTAEMSAFDRFMEMGIPLVFYDRVPLETTSAYIIKGDDYRGGLLAGRHLSELGCKQVAFINGLLSSSIYKERMQGFKDGLAHAGLDMRSEYTFYQELTQENAWNCLRKLFSNKDVPDGIFAANDTTAIAAVEFARERDIKIPDELKVIGYSNDPRTAIITPAITSIEQYPGEMAEKVAATLIHALNKPMENHIKQPLICPVDLVRRMST
ncbi:transcriptional regulator, LacI family [bacterium A37T11]|nr:transcriptional regulator, LacI family [bacterium A37T11]